MYAPCIAAVLGLRARRALAQGRARRLPAMALECDTCPPFCVQRRRAGQFAVAPYVTLA